jgi:outer membrane receptor for ferrienterochelin and colicin
MKFHAIRAYAILTILILLILTPIAVGAKSPTTIKQQMDILHNRRKVNFVYDATINVEQKYNGPSIEKMSLQKALKTLFDDTGITFEQRGNYIILRKRVSHTIETKVQRHHTLSGYIRDGNGESLINATVYDLTTGLGTTTNEYGFFSLTLAEGNHKLRISYIGFDDEIKDINLDRDRHIDINLKENAKLGEVVVTGDMNSPLLNTQTGKRSLSAKDINTEFSLLSSPDVVKTLQRISGVSEGMELASGMYVHGGNDDENLFMIDGTPLYQINHTMGLFSSFNTDVVKNVDFYKSGFPARYGGRLSSVVDVRTTDGDMHHWHGSYRIGLLDGSFQLEGPIKPGKTSFNFGLRRSWLDLFSIPAFAIINKNNDGEKEKMSYTFHDFNGKITHIFNDRSKISLNIYSGNDAFSTKDDESWNKNDKYLYKNDFKWGNFNAAFNWSYQFSPKLFANFTAVYTHNRASFKTSEDDREDINGKTAGYVSYSEHSYRSTIYDGGYRMAFDYRPNPHHHIRFGHDYTMHLFRPQTHNYMDYYGSNTEIDTIKNESQNRHVAHEFTLYAEDEMTLDNHWSFNAGLNADMFNIGSKSFAHLDPRMAVKYQISPSLSLKASYTMMTQFVHKISNSFLNLPTDYWVPTTERLHPMHSQQIAAGIYSQVSSHWFVSLEGYYKFSNHLLQYASWMGLEPPADKWDYEVMDGKGIFYGAELDAHYIGRKLTLDASYTLSWNKRKYEDFYKDWYYDKFDNRHKFNVCARYKFNNKIAGYAAWSYHSGNRMTIPTQYSIRPSLPEENGKINDYHFITDNDAGFVYDKPNNISLPAYHRLDIGFDFHHVTKHGHERIWNLSIYNAYCHLNPLFVRIRHREDGSFKVKTQGYVPIVPSFSYTIKF